MSAVVVTGSNASHAPNVLLQPDGIDLELEPFVGAVRDHGDALEVPGEQLVVGLDVDHPETDAERGIQAEVIKLYGSMELAPLVGLADCIVDVVDTGKTLQANGLEPLELIMEVSSRLIVNKAALKMKHDEVTGFIQELKQVLDNRP